MADASATTWSHTAAGPEKSTVGTPRSAFDHGAATPSRATARRRRRRCGTARRHSTFERTARTHRPGAARRRQLLGRRRRPPLPSPHGRSAGGRADGSRASRVPSADQAWPSSSRKPSVATVVRNRAATQSSGASRSIARIERRWTVRSTVGTPKRSVSRVNTTGYPRVGEGGDERGVVRPRLGEADPPAGLGRRRRPVPRRAGDVAVLVALAHRDESRRVIGVVDGVGVRVVREARVGERRADVVHHGEGGRAVAISRSPWRRRADR